MPVGHNGGHLPYSIDLLRCTHCAGCASVCPVAAIEVDDSRAEITTACRGCGTCLRFCPVGAVRSIAPEVDHV